MFTKEALQEKRAKLSPEKRALLQKRLRGELTELSQPTTIPRRPSGDSAPLSFAQERMWFLYALEPESPTYNESATSRIQGKLNLIAMRRAYREVVRRHEILRTTFHLVDDQPVQIVAPVPEDWDFSVVDLTHLPADERLAQATKVVEAERKRPFNLSEEFPWRTLLICLAEDDVIISLTQHHIACDGWSITVFKSELGQLYHAYCHGQSLLLPELPIQYADFAYWERQMLTGPTQEKSLGYWQQQLSGLSTLQLATDRPRPPVVTSNGAIYRSTLPLSLVRAMEKLGQANNGSGGVPVTEFMKYLAALQILLHRYTGQEDIVVGSTVASRNRPELENIIGFFLNTLVLRTDLSGNPTYMELLKRVRQTALGAFANQDLPIDYLVTKIPFERDPSRNPLFQILFIWQDWDRMNNNQVTTELDVAMSDVEAATGRAKFDITLSMEKKETGVNCTWEYNTDLFNEQTIVRMDQHMHTLLNGIVSSPEMPIARLPLLDKDEQQLLQQINQTITPFAHQRCIHELFAEQAGQTPEATAVFANGKSFTYRQLNQRANQLAHYLQRYGISAGHRIGISVERSLDMIVGVLGILKAGGAYVPLDPDYPAERLAYIMQDADVSVLITHNDSPFADGLFVEDSVRVINLDRDSEQISQEEDDEPQTAVSPHHLAYLIYTSGSTGQPKGVMVPHQALVNYISAARDFFKLGPGERLLQFASLNFDAAAEEIYPTLISGATLVLRTDAMLDSVAIFLEQCHTLGITVLDMPTAYWHELVAALKADNLTMPPAVRLLVIGGERALPERFQTWQKIVGKGVQLLNTYGPTETTIVATVADLTQNSTLLHPAAELPIGQPVANDQVYVLDKYLQPVPIGVPGELYIGGVGVTQGYLHRPGLTAARFIPDPFSQTPGARLYRTGDLVRYRLGDEPDAKPVLEFLGRIDQQVKIRGFRVELGEIEAALVQHPAVQDTAVLLHSDKSGRKQLIAYIVPIDDPTDPAALRRFLQEKLPAYMIPVLFTTIEQLPLMPGGKVDRQALAQSGPVTIQRQAEFVAPSDDIEKQLAAIWEKVLTVQPIGVHDDFFSLGGHSLLAIRITAHIRRTLEVDISLRKLFEKLTIAELATEIRGDQGSTQKAPAIVPVSREAELPLSFAQQRLWFLYQLQPESAIYTIPLAMRLTGTLNIEALENALSDIVQRHEVLRTAFDLGTTEPVQIIQSATPITLPLIDLRHLSPTEQRTEVQQRAAAEAQRPFDLTQAPLLRGHLLQLGENDHIFFLTIDHIVFDEWSMDIFGREMAALYRGYVTGQPVELPTLPVQYADYAAWQRSWLRDDVLAAQLDYWRQQLAAVPPILELPIDRPRPALQTYAGASHTFVLPAALSEPLLALSRAQGTTMYMTMLTAFKILLSRYTQQTDIIVGSPIANRNQVEVENLIGFFLNTLVLRTDLSGNPTFRELLLRVRETTLGAYAHQELPFEKLVELLQPERNLSTSPFFQTMFVLHNGSETRTNFRMPGLELQPLPVDGRRARFDLTLYLQESSRGLEGEFEYNTDLFDRETIEQMGRHFEQLVGAVVANPEVRMLDVPLLTVVEQKQLATWNETKRPLETNGLLHSGISQQAARTPTAIALRVGEETISYAELNGRANQLAHHLRTLGVGAEVRVGVLLPRTAELVVTLLAVLKAGGTYVPLDPAYPVERLRLILTDAEAAVIVTNNSVPVKVAEITTDERIQVVDLGQDDEQIKAKRADEVETVVIPANLAYLIYTSGSTGRPKGVAITHGNAAALLGWGAELYSPAELAGVLAATSICFDLSIYELFLPLTQGGSIILAQDALHLAELPAREQVTLVNTVPSVMSELVRHGTLPGSVVTVNLAGEPLTRALADEVYSQPNVQRVYNLYGPSEDTTYSTGVLVERASQTEPAIGRAISNSQAYVLDGKMQPVPPGIVGELYLGGAGVSRGYLNRPGLTASKYVPDPFSPEPGARLYRTGDMARWRRDGQLLFLGRGDHQVKVRGYRIELGEVEAVLSQHPAVAAAVVTVHGREPEDKQIVGYVVGAEGSELNVEEVRRYLQERLPSYMVPSILLRLAALPQTPNGKIDRKGLPAPAADRSQVTVAYVAPRTPVEEMVAAVWADVLGLERVGVLDNFFTLGGHSLMAVRIASRLRQAMAAEVQIRMLFESPTVASLALTLETGVLTNPNPAITPVDRSGDLPLSFAQQRLWFLEQLDPGSTAYSMPFALILNGSLDIPRLEGSLNEIVRRHEILRTTFATVDGNPVQIIQPEMPLTISVIDLRHLPATECDAAMQTVGAQEISRPFDLTEGPLLRATLLRLMDERYGLLVNLHHIVADEWSLDILGREIVTLYRNFGQERPLLPLPIQYADYAAWQRNWLQGAVLDEQIAYWRQQLQGAPDLLVLPTDRPRPAVQTARGATLSFDLPPDLAAAVQALSRQEGMSLFMILLAGFQTLLHRYSGENNIVVGSPVANRSHLETEGLIGFFVNTLVFHTDMSGAPTFRELLARVREVALSAYGHQDLPFEKLVERLHPSRNLSHHPLFQVMFTLQNAKTDVPDIPGLRIEPLALPNQTAKFDLTLTLEETAVSLTGSWEYNTDLFNADTIERFNGHFQQLLTALVANPDQTIDDVPLLSPAEIEQQLLIWNDTAVSIPQDLCIHHLFEQQVRRTPTAVALEAGGEKVSYRQLNRRSNQLAHYLRGLGVGSDTRVGVLMTRTADMVVALMGILKAGGAYVPLDPDYPVERLVYTVQDANLALLLTQSETDGLLTGEAQAAALEIEIINVNSVRPLINQQAQSNPKTAITPADVAYLIYTSGSTGQPKGVMVPHAALVNYTAVAQQQYQINPGQRLLQFSSLSFDIAVEEIFGTLIGGATLVLRDDEMLASVKQFLERCQQWGITVLDLPTAYWHELVTGLEQLNSALPPAIRLVIIGGERALPEQFRLWQARVGDAVQLVNTYGPTEATVAATGCDLTGHKADGRELSIGWPLGNSHTYILDQRGQLVPVGVPGELHIGGAGISYGYHGRPRQTAVAFIPDPFSTEPGARLYRTGDLARYRPDGQIEFLGRRDQQVKIHGFRVEPGEIESVLMTHGEVAETAVRALDDGHGQKQLAAYIVPKGGAALEISEIRTFLQKRLPVYIIPTSFTILEKLPLTPNGKIDRQALPLPKPTRPDEAAYVAPRTPAEMMMAKIWAEVLRVQKVGIRDNFFALGGHSLIATQLISRIRDAFQMEMPLRLLFEEPTIGELVSHIEVVQWAGDRPIADSVTEDYEEFVL